MNRASIMRFMLLVIGAALVTAGLVGDGAAAQQSARLIKIGALTESWGPSAAIVGLRDGLQALGYRENEHFVIGVRFTEGNLSDLPEAARSLVQRGSDIIVTGGGDNAAKAARLATTQIPVVFMGASDPVAAGLVKSFARPGGNVTGIADLGVELAAKRLEIFHELVPGLKRVLFAYDATDSYAVTGLGAHRDAARRLGLTLVEKAVRSQEEAQAVIGAARKTDVDGLFSPSRLSLNIPGFLLETGPKRTLPTMFHDPYFVERGGLASYSASNYQIGRQAARIVAKIMKGAKPADVPVEQPTEFELVVNLKTAKALGLTIPPSIMVRANRLIQ